MFVNSGKIIKILNEMAPEHLAESWDNVGLLVGNADSEVDRIMVALEATEAVVQEAVDSNIDLLICHHPLIFKPMKKIVDSDAIGKLVRKLIKNDISLYAAHTNLDIAEGGTNDYLAEILGLQDVVGLEKTSAERYKKLMVFVPEDDSEAVRMAMASAGAGKIGNYEACAFKTSGEGSFMPLDGANPAIGEIGKLERVEEVRLEMIVDAPNLGRVLSAMHKAHPYEVPAYDVISLENEIKTYHLGRVGRLADKQSLETFAATVKAALGVKALRFVGDKDRTIRKAAICTGAGSDMMRAAAAKGCDVLITGDVKYHEAQTALQMNLTLIDAGHYETEQIYVERFAERLRNAFSLKSYEVAVISSKSEKNPFETV